MIDKRVYKYDNGATIIYQRDKRLNYSAVFAGFISGSCKNEHNGVAHFVEHMMFKNTENLTNEQIDNENRIITSFNASTSMSRIIVEFSQTNRLLDRAMKLSAELLLRPKYLPEHIEKEKGVIKEEYLRKIDLIHTSLSAQISYNFTNVLRP